MPLARLVLLLGLPLVLLLVLPLVPARRSRSSRAGRSLVPASVARAVAPVERSRPPILPVAATIPAEVEDGGVWRKIRAWSGEYHRSRKSSGTRS